VPVLAYDPIEAALIHEYHLSSPGAGWSQLVYECESCILKPALCRERASVHRMLGRANLAEESFLQEVLNVTPAIENAMDVDRCGFEGIYDSVGFVVQFPEV